jgi:hypothetical protein
MNTIEFWETFASCFLAYSFYNLIKAIVDHFFK